MHFQPRVIVKAFRIKPYEYWPYWLFYAPFVLYWILRSIQSSSFSYFCKVNPGIEFGGFLDYSKFDLLDQLPNEFKPQTILIQNKDEFVNSFDFPFIVKPNFGERGVNVELIQSEMDWENYSFNENIIIQEFIDLPLEFGVFYVREPDHDKGEILSITGKEFLVFKSDGKTTLEEFVLNHPRTATRVDYLKNKFKDQWRILLPKGEEILLEPIGNHNRGTRFYDASDLITKELSDTMDKLSKHLNGFYYGRFDVKSESIDAFQKGNLVVLEVNGANSEPTHIYDQKFNLIQAYREIKSHLDYQYKISKLHSKTHRPKDFYKAIWKRISRKFK